MSKKSPSNRLVAFFKLLLAVVCAVLGMKVFLAILSTVTVGVAIATLAMWGLGALVLGGSALFLGSKLLAGKKK